MSPLIWIVVFTVLGGVLSVLAASAFLLLPDTQRLRLLPALVSFAIGALLGAAFLALMPHAIESAGMDAHRIGAAVLGGILLFFLLEKMVLWRHNHEHHDRAHCADHAHTATAGTLILFGDAIHNFVDGVLIASAFMTDVRLGVVTSLAVVAHEIPQEVGDFAILLYSGFSRLRAFVANILVSLTTVLGGVLTYFSLSAVSALVPYVLAVAAASFIYVAVADLIPTLHRRVHGRAVAVQAALMGAGVATIAIAEAALH